MCGRFTQYSDAQVYASHFDVAVPFETQPRYNLAPTQLVLAVSKAVEGTRELVPLRWGLVAYWRLAKSSRAAWAGGCS
jgi:putative SOS response-associated peptidase YedK